MSPYFGTSFSHSPLRGHQHSSVIPSLSKSKHSEFLSKHSLHLNSLGLETGRPQWVWFTNRYLSLQTHLKSVPFHLQFELIVEHIPGMHSSPSFFPIWARLMPKTFRYHRFETKIFNFFEVTINLNECDQHYFELNKPHHLFEFFFLNSKLISKIKIEQKILMKQYSWLVLFFVFTSFKLIIQLSLLQLSQYPF